jgi:molecular chaperone GrpE
MINKKKIKNEEEFIEDEYVVEEEGIGIKLDKLKKELAECKKERDEYLTGWQRARADSINERRQEEQERGIFLKTVSEKLIRDLLPLVDSLDFSVDNGEKQNAVLLKQLLEILKQHGVRGIVLKLEDSFDPQFHEALQQEEVDDDKQDGIILEIFQKGYIMNDKVIRPTKVKVGVYKHKT